MLSKKGNPVPVPLSPALQKNKKAATVFQAMRPSWQQEYINRINNAKAGSRPEKAITVLAAILE